MNSIGLQNSVLGINNSQKMMDNLLLQIQTGKRINKAADDSAGMSIADSLKTQALSLAQGTKNANDAMGMLDIADGAMSTYKETLLQMKEKAVKAASDGESSDSRKALQSDINNFMKSLNKIAANTEFNGIKLLNGSFVNKSFQVGAYSGQTVDMSIFSVETQKVGHVTNVKGADVSAGTTAATLAINGQTIAQTTVSGTTKDGADLVAKAINAASENSGVTATAENSVTGASVVGGSLANGDLNINGISIGAVNFQANDNTGSLADAINAVSNKTGVSATINGNGALELTSANGENIHITEANGGAAKAGLTAGTNYGSITLSSQDGISIANGDAVSGMNATTSSNFTLADLNLTSKSTAQDAMTIIDNAISEISRYQSEVGAATNQMSRIIAVNDVTQKNVEAAESTIRSVDVAKAQEEYSNWSLRNQASLFAFSAAQQNQQNILSLLR